MPTTFRPYHPDQFLLLSPDLREWLPPGHLTHHVCDLVDVLELRAFYAPYEGDGRRNAPYEPSMVVKVLIYAYATGVFSSRAIARKLEEDVAFRVLAAGRGQPRPRVRPDRPTPPRPQAACPPPELLRRRLLALLGPTRRPATLPQLPEFEV